MSGLFRCACLAACMLSGVGATAIDHQRALSLDDFPDQRVSVRLDEGQWSPDGSKFVYLVYGRKHPARVGELGAHQDGSDVWVVDARTGRNERVTDADPDTTYSEAKWSPDGQRLAFVAYHDNDAWMLVWSERTRAISKAFQETINTGSEKTFAWLSNAQLLCLISANDQEVFGRSTTVSASVPLRAISAWRSAWLNQLDGVSVLDVGAREREGTLRSLDIRTGSSTVLWTGNATEINLSPDRGYVAIYATAETTSTLTERLNTIAEQPSGVVRLLALEIKSHRVALDYTASLDDGSGDRLPIVWSHDSHKFAFCTRGSGKFDSPIRIHVADLESGVPPTTEDKLASEAERRGFSTFVISLDWSTSRLLALLGPSHPNNGAAAAIGKSTWVVVNSSADFEPIRNPTGKGFPSEWLVGPDGKELLGASDGSLWKLSEGSRDVAPFVPRITNVEALIQQAGLAPANRLRDHALIRVPGGPGGDCWYDLNLLTEKTRLLASPQQQMSFVSYSFTGNGIFLHDDYKETRVWLVGEDQAKLSGIWSLNNGSNVDIREITVSPTRRFKYTDASGRSLGADLVLPYGYTKGKRYPLVVWVYSGQMIPMPETEDVCVSCDLQPSDILRDLFMNPQVLAAKGYLVLTPSMPLPSKARSTRPSLSSDEPAKHLLDGVLPAIDKVIELGYADAKRVAVMGHSFGGFDTYSIITQTDRFKAAIAIAGSSDFVSRYGTFSPWNRYSSAPLDISQMSWAEAGQAGLGAPPWSDPEVYLRNSPVFHADKIETPLLIIQGDMDFVPIQQGEEMFTAMQRLNKKCRFVRYYGAGHEITKPSQAKDMWRRIFGWLDENLPADQRHP